MLRRLMLCAVVGATVVASRASADRITLTNGSVIECQVLQETTDRVSFRRGNSAFSLLRSQIATINKEKHPTTMPAEDLPTAAGVLGEVAHEAWAVGLEQIPATVIDKGILKNVPYTSYQFGDYELNVYGDPEAPAGIELGVYRTLLKDASAKERCLRFVSQVCGKKYADAILKLNREKDSKKIGDVTLEVTPPTDEDAYGGWWVSVYIEPKLESSRASAEEMKVITLGRQDVSRAAQAAKDAQVATAIDRIRGTTADYSGEDDNWTPGDMSRARRPSATAVATGGGGPVYVRGYYRKNGTYVRSYTRSAPGRGGGRR